VKQLSIQMGKKEILLQVDDDATDAEIEAALQKRFKKAPLKPVEFKPARIELGDMKFTHEPLKIPDFKTTVQVDMPDAKVMARSILQSQASTAETVASLQSMVSEVLTSRVEFPAPCGWDCTLVRDDNGNLKKLRFEPI